MESGAARLRTRPDAELDAVGVAITIVGEPLVADAAPAARRVERVAAADPPAIDVPDAARHQSSPRNDGGAVDEMDRACQLARELAGLRHAAQRHADKLAAEFRC